MRGLNGYGGYGCNNGVCVPECRYYPKEGRIEDEEVESWYEKRRTKNPDQLMWNIVEYQGANTNKEPKFAVVKRTEITRVHLHPHSDRSIRRTSDFANPNQARLKKGTFLSFSLLSYNGKT